MKNYVGFMTKLEWKLWSKVVIERILKKIGLIVSLCVVVMCITGCGKETYEADLEEMQAVISAQEDEAASVSGNLEQGIKDRNTEMYYKAMEELTTPGGGLDLSAYEGVNGFGKFGNMLLYHYSNIYAAIRSYYVYIMLTVLAIGGIVAACSTKNKTLRRFALFNICIYTNVIIVIIVFGVGLFNHFVIGG